VFSSPGRLDRIFIFPENTGGSDAEKMLRQYLGTSGTTPQGTDSALVGYPGAFIREGGCLCADPMAYDDLTNCRMSCWTLVQRSQSQLDARR